MKIRLIAPFAALVVAQPAWAEDALPWTLSVSGGSTSAQGQNDQPFASVALSREIGAGYLKLSATHTSNSDAQGLIAAIPAKTDQVTLAGGRSFGDLSADAYLSLGKRSFGAEEFRRRTGQTVTIDSNGSTFGGGLSLSYDIPMGDHASISPFVSGDYYKVDIARAVNLPLRGLVSQIESQDGVTGAAGINAQLSFGAEDRHSFGLYLGGVTTSNTTAYNRGGSGELASRILATFDRPGVKDSWAEYGASASFGLSPRVRLDGSVVRTAGFAGGETTSVSAALRFHF